MRRLLIVTLAVAVSVGCATTQEAELAVRVDFDETTDFQSWKTFRFATFPAESAGGTRTRGFDTEVEQAIGDNLAGRGYERIEDGIPDFRIAFELASRGDRGSDAERTYASDTSLPAASAPTKTNTLRVIMLDPVNTEVLWEGQVAGFSLDAIQYKAKIKGAVWRLFVEFPPITN
jgi:hypothetical protein